MTNRSDREILDQLLEAVRKRLFFKTALTVVVQGAFAVLPVTAALIAANQRWGNPAWSWPIAVTALLALFAMATFKALLGLGARVCSALAIDERANLKDRITSAYEFLAKESLDEPRAVQIRDAIRHARALNSGRLFQFQWPRHPAYLTGILAACILSFLVPPALVPESVASTDTKKQRQMEEFKALQDELAFEEAPNEELKELLEKLKDMQKRFERGDLSERDLMLHLARLDEDLRQKTKELGVENLEGEMNLIVPHLMSSAAATQVAAALKENELDKAVEELEKLAHKVKEDKVTKEQKRELAMNMGVAASKMAGKKSASFGGDFSKASEALEKSDGDEFESACKSIGDKLCTVKKARTMKRASQKLGECKACLGQCHSNELGYKLGQKTQSKGKGGLKAGTAAAGDPFGEASRLEDSYRNLIRVTGQSGEGPVETEVEVTEGQLSQSQVNLKELHANFEAVAEEAIEKDAIPLSHRFHVKRYFQTIRPKE